MTQLGCSAWPAPCSGITAPDWLKHGGTNGNPSSNVAIAKRLIDSSQILPMPTLAHFFPAFAFVGQDSRRNDAEGEESGKPYARTKVLSARQNKCQPSRIGAGWMLETLKPEQVARNNPVGAVVLKGHGFEPCRRSFSAACESWL